MMHTILIIGIFISFSCNLSAQQTRIQGKVVEENTNIALVGVNILIKDQLAGTVTDSEGNFSMSTGISPPFILVFSSVGYRTQERRITESQTGLLVQMQEEVIFGQEVVVAASRVEENILESPVSVEKLDILDIRHTPAANFYDGLYALKGVDVNAHSLTFRLPNTRGFNGNTNYRLNQIVDGIDNSLPALNFAAGNIFGLSPLDIESVELLVGASSALYGPGGMNGTLLMNSKDPFQYQGLSFMAQTGLMHVNASYRDDPALMGDFHLRYAQAFNDRFAFKINASYLRAIDWQGTDYRDRTNLDYPALTRDSNPGYDGVNVYGDEVTVPVNLKDVAPQVAAGIAEAQGYQPGTPAYDTEVNRIVGLFPDQVITRTGYREKDLVDYNTKNLRLSGSMHYRITANLEAEVQGNYAQGTSVYTAQNRFSLINFDVFSGKVELKSPDFFVRAWGVREGAGDTYDAGATALRMNEAWKPSQDWYPDYIEAFAQSLLLGNTEQTAHRFARFVSDNRDANGNILNPDEPARPLPGTSEFNQLKEQITSTPINEGGARIVDKSQMYQFEAMYNFQRHIKVFELLAGISHRIYHINTEGTAFFDTPGNPIRINQFGAYLQLSKKLLANHLKLTGSARYDKNENFEGRVTPRFSMVYAPDQEMEHFFRVSVQTAFRFPPIPDQLVDLDVGAYRVIGGIPELHQKYNFDTNPVYPLTGPNPLVDEPVVDNGPFEIPAFRPERVTALELGYRGLYFQKKLYVDAYIFQNTYNGFLATQVLAQNPNTPEERLFQTTISTDDPITAYGWALGADYNVLGYIAKGNISFNGLESLGDRPPGFQSRFNTPDYRLNLGISKRNVFKNIGFSINWRWQNDFLWETSFGVGNIPAFHTLDAQLSLKLKKLKSILKVGSSNALNNYYTTGFGNSQIGGLYYISWTYDVLLN